jgi:DNA-binding transcriptional LysR family regulator
VTFIQHWMARRALQEGGLVRVLADYDPNPVELAIPLCVVYPHSHGLPPKTRAFVDFLVSVFKEIEADTLETHSCRPHHRHPARG